MATSKKLGGVDLSALKESIKCMKAESSFYADLGTAESFISNRSDIEKPGPSTVGSSLTSSEEASGICQMEDDEFLGAEARSRCYTWPVAATEHQPVNFTVLSSRGLPEEPSLTTSAEGSTNSVNYASQNHQPHVGLITSGNGGPMLCSSIYSSTSQQDVCGSIGDGNALSNFSYYRTLCSSSPAFGSPPDCTSVLTSSQHYFGSEASCSFATGSNHFLPYDFGPPIQGVNATTSIPNTNFDTDDSIGAKLKKRVKKIEFAIPYSTNESPTASSSGICTASNILTNTGIGQQQTGQNLTSANVAGAPQKKPNAWGSDSYAELIEKAILSSPGGRLKLNEIYDWFIDNIPYFCKRSSQDGAVGWKNSIRHNLSLHSRFMRIQNEGAGKSSWWVINPEAKPGRNPRRRAATLEAAAAKVMIDKKRRGAKKRLEMNGTPGVPSAGSSQFCRPAGSLQSVCPSALSSQASLLSQDLFSDFAAVDNFSTFRPRTQSLLPVTSRMSPTSEPPGFEDFKFPCPEPDTSVCSGSTASNGNSGQVAELLNRTDQMRIDGGASSAQSSQPGSALTNVNARDFRPQPAATINNGNMEQPTTQIQTSPFISTIQQQADIKTEISESTVKQEIVAQPPSYQELNAVRSGVQISQNPLLRSPLQQQQNTQQQLKNETNTNGGMLNYFANGVMFGSNQGTSTMNYNTTIHTAPWQQSQSHIPPHTQPHSMQSSSNFMAYGSCGTTSMAPTFPVTASASAGMESNGSAIMGNLTNNNSVSGITNLPVDLENLSMNHSMMEVDVDELLRYDMRLDSQQQPDGNFRFELP